MKIQRFEVPGLAQYSYVVSSGKEAIVIDPMRDIERYLSYAAMHGLSIVAVTETHLHADFASGAAALARATGAELALSGYDDDEVYQYKMNHRALRDGDEIRAGKVRLSALHTPGHTPEHLSFVLYDEDRSVREPAIVFTGDFLFVGSVGRPDLLGAGEKERLANELYQSLHERIDSLRDSVQVYPGHGAGSLCGAGLSERAESTLGYERTTQSLYALGQEEFVRTILESVPPLPAYYPRMKKLNAEGACRLDELVPLKALSPAEFNAAISPNKTILDVRGPEAFGGAHLLGAVNIGAGQNLSLWAGWMLDPEKPILLIAEDGDIEETRTSLARVGLDGIAGYLDEGMSAWIRAGLDFTRTNQISIAAVQHREPSAIVLDVRSDGEWNSGHIEGAQHIMLGDLPGQMEELPRAMPVIAVCGSGYRSNIAASLLQAHGLERVSSMDGGMSAWKKRAMAISKEAPVLMPGPKTLCYRHTD